MIEVRRGSDRFRTEAEGVTTRHSFSFGAHYDPGNVGFAVLVAHNDELLEPGAGYPEHPHTDVEIVTWVLEGALHHQDTAGNGGLVHPGLVQRLSAGRGVRHAETNDAGGIPGPTRFVQMWLRPDEPGLDPSYAQRDVDDALAGGGLVPLASGDPSVDAALRVHTGGAVLLAARPGAGSALDLPAAPHVHVFVTRGSVDVDGVGALDEADALRLTGEDDRRVTASEDTELLVWSMR
ncbi:MAG: pirin family protein [Nocardioidaceae bacterium]|nr:pirin family protein [Nocardioidaceae bacterium]NUS53148.1 pirin family protein [Nocardioidaceae bacterium]